MLNRAYAVLEVKASADDGDRTISGWATTPSPDRSNDTINPLGVKFANPLPLLWQHNSDEPIGTAIFGKPTAKGIPFTATIASFEDPPGLKARVDEAWNSIRAKLVRGVSIGFKALKYSYLDNGGVEYDETEVVELSVVTIPCNSEATINVIKSIDRKSLGASAHAVIRLPRPGVTGNTATGIVRVATSTPQEGKTMNVQKQIESFTAARQKQADVIKGLLEASEAAGESFSAEQQTQYDDAKSEITTIDKHLTVLNESAQLMLGKAVRLTPTGDNEGETPEQAAARIAKGVEGSRIIAVEKKLPPGIAFTRLAKSLIMANGNAREAFQIAKETFPNEAPLHNVLKMLQGQGRMSEFIEKAAVAGALTSVSAWAGALVQYQDMANDFIEYLRPQTIIGRLPGLRHVPFKVRVPRQTGGGSASWVGEGKGKPLTSLAFDTVLLEFTKIATIAVLTDEVVRLSSPSAEAITRDQLAAAVIQQMDSDFIDPANAGSANVKPASITNGATSFVATGTNTQAGIATDVMNVFGPWIGANVSPVGGAWIMSPSTAMALGLMVNSLGNQVFPGMDINGGTFMGLPVVVSQSAGLLGASDGAHIVVLLKQSDIMIADDGVVAIDASREASLEMSDAPSSNSSSPTGASLVSMFQTNSVALRAERWVNWVKARSTAVSYLTGVHWGGYPS